MRRITYSLGGVTFDSLGITVSGSSGLLDRPKRKPPLTIDYPDSDGEIVDLSECHLQPRDIVLQCFCSAQTPAAFAAAMDALYDVLDTPGTIELKIQLSSTFALTYQVYCLEPVKPDKTWGEPMVGTFKLQLREPVPPSTTTNS